MGFGIGKWAVFKMAGKLWGKLRGKKRRGSALRSRDPLLLVAGGVFVLVLAVWFVWGRVQVRIAGIKAEAAQQISAFETTRDTNIRKIERDADKKIRLAKVHEAEWKLAYENQEQELKTLRWTNTRLRANYRKRVVTKADGSSVLEESFGLSSDEGSRSSSTGSSRVVKPGDLPSALAEGPDLMKPPRRRAKSGVWVGGGFLSGGFGEVSVQHGRIQVGGAVNDGGDVGVRAALRVF